MSRIGERPVPVPGGVTVTVDAATVTVTGPKGELRYTLPAPISAAVNTSEVVLTRRDDTAKAFHGLSRSLVANMVTGVSEGYRKVLLIEGVGFRAAVQGSVLSLSLGFASPKEYKIPEGIEIAVNNNTEVTVSGADKQQVGAAAAWIRSYYPVEPYKGKGIHYRDERVRRKEGKTVA